MDNPVESLALPLILVLIVLFLLRREFKRALLRWMEGGDDSSDQVLTELIACEKQRMQEQARDAYRAASVEKGPEPAAPPYHGGD